MGRSGGESLGRGARRVKRAGGEGLGRWTCLDQVRRLSQARPTRRNAERRAPRDTRGAFERRSGESRRRLPRVSSRRGHAWARREGDRAMSGIQEVLTQYVARFADRQPDWDAFADARVGTYGRG